MHYRLIAQVLAILVVILAGAMVVPGALAALWGEPEAARAFFYAVAASLGVAMVLVAIGGVRRLDVEILHREAFLVVTLAWVSAGVLGGLPFWFSSLFGGFTNGVFESVSGFTTTGATILSAVEPIPRSLLLWRATTHWLGGMGIVLLSVAILPLLGVGGMELYKAEVPGPTTEKLKPRIRETAKVLWRTYLVLTLAEIVLLMIFGMDLFDAVAHTFATMATGGFSTKNKSIESFDSAPIEAVIVVFMFLAGTNFTLHFLAARKGYKGLLGYLKDPEFRAYAGIAVGSTVIVAGFLWVHGTYDLFGSFRYGVFQVVSILTTTGFSSADFEAWGGFHALPPFILFGLMFIGGSAGSTGGGLKVVRVWLLLKEGLNELFRQIHPRAVRPLKFGGRVVPPTVLKSVTAFFVLYILLFATGAVLLSVMGMDFVSAVVGSVACISNIGPGLGTLGPLDNYDHVPEPGKWVLIALMILGRLELYTVLVLVLPAYWRR